jgi:lipopolysaccharide transport system ATP-binding protein
MNDVVIRVEQLGKRFMISHNGGGDYGTLRDTISNGVKAATGRLTSLMRGTDSRSTQEQFWALKDVSFEIRRGDRVGIIGRNGAGKSTLLKILGRITEPTLGSVTIEGRVASLLEVGTGFHPELTGRENTFLNGAILGMNRTEIRRKFEQIVEFSGIERFLDTPVKRYSSGMYVRLAFAVAAHLEPEILIVDEVLAVGDLEFQKKCLGKMQEVSRQEGRTVLFVSHNLEAVQRLCPSSIFLEKGKLVSAGDTGDVLMDYLSMQSAHAPPNVWTDLREINRSGNNEARFTRMRYASDNANLAFHPYSGGSLEIELEIESKSEHRIDSLAVSIYSKLQLKLINCDLLERGQSIYLQEGMNRVTFHIERLNLKPGIYQLGLWLAKTMGAKSNFDILDYSENVCDIEVVKLRPGKLDVDIDDYGVVTADFDVTVSKSDSR